MATILYSGHEFHLPDEVDVGALTEAILDTCANGAHSWVTIPTPGANQQALRLLIGPGIPVAVISD